MGKPFPTTELPINYSFAKINIGEPVIHLPDDVLHDLSTDQAYGYKIIRAIRTGHLPKNLALFEIGPVKVAHNSKQTMPHMGFRAWTQGKTLQEPQNDSGVHCWRILSMLV